MTGSREGSILRCRAIVAGCGVWMVASWLLVVGLAGPGAQTTGLAAPLAGRVLAIWFAGLFVAWPILVLIFRWTAADAAARVGTLLVMLALGLAPLAWWAGWPRAVDPAILLGVTAAMACLEGAVALSLRSGTFGMGATAMAIVLAGSLGGSIHIASRLGESSPASLDAMSVALAIAIPPLFPLAVAAIGLIAKAIPAR